MCILDLPSWEDTAAEQEEVQSKESWEEVGASKTMSLA
jgi:hypothetical protein